MSTLPPPSDIGFSDLMRLGGKASYRLVMGKLCLIEPTLGQGQGIGVFVELGLMSAMSMRVLPVFALHQLHTAFVLLDHRVLTLCGKEGKMVGATGIEPVTPTMST